MNGTLGGGVRGTSRGSTEPGSKFWDFGTLIILEPLIQTISSLYSDSFARSKSFQW